MKDDGQLIDETLGGESAAFGELVCRYQDRLFGTILHVVGCREEAEDAVQDAFIQAYVKLNTFQQNSAFYTWLYRIAFNVAVSRSRKKRPTVSVEQARDLTGGEPLDDAEAPTERMEREERAAQVEAALGQLSPEHRSILVLREIEGMCYEDIADVLELALGTVRSRLHRARLELRDQLKAMLQEDHN